ncbi:S-layer homology domain-containing protein [Sporosarcina sp. Marseille-Q4943]|uniref:S-layer homology domain-containing protein n=1 Tax=Sporosarcina sp. Marseille-Q4943 TaxID=2942204 RepID=UPI00208DA876|nr:S-layer homology domain-containing protein [Sporosarcina sp. Marseille-Q4943]
MFIRKLKLSIGAFAIAGSLLVSQQVNAASMRSFTDVPTTKPYANAVYELAERNIISGYEDGTFKPAASITRGQAAAIIAKLRNLDTKNVKDPGFKDVPHSQWSYGAIAALANAGVINGYGDGRFGPNDSITRAQMASILVKAFELPHYTYTSSENPFTDTQRLGSHQTNINILYKLGITSGTSSSTFSPNAPISRAQAAVLISKTEKVKATIITIKAADFGWDTFTFTPYEEPDDIIHAVRSTQFTWKQIQLVPMQEGTATLSLIERPRDQGSSNNYRKYYVHVTKEDEQLKLTLEQSEDILPAEVSLLTGQIKKISLATMEGVILEEEVKLKPCNYTVTQPVSSCLFIDEPGEYIATVHFENGKVVRYGISASVNKTSFYLDVQTIEEQPELTIDLGGSAAELGKHVLPEGSEKIAVVTRDKDSNKFHIKGVSEGTVNVKFSASKGAIEELTIHVQKIGSIIKVIAAPADKYH